MQEYVVNRPDEGAMDRILEKNFDNAAGVILRLAWQAGLLREELQSLTWAQIDFLDSCFVLPDRRVPISGELASWLSALREKRNRVSETVVLSGSGGDAPVVVKNVSPTYRGALVVCQGGGSAEVRLAVTQAVAALTGLSADRITVVKCQ